MKKKILITGGAGFIAHRFVYDIITRTDWDVVCLDRLDFAGNLNRLTHILAGNDQASRVRIVYHDLKSEINPVISKLIGEVDYIAHMAAGSHVDRSIDHPMEFVMDNVVGTCNILNFARTRDIERFIYFSTDEVFGPAPGNIMFDEYDRYNSSNPYSASKAGGEELAVAFENTYKIPMYITHTMNVFGERQSPEKYIPLCIRKILNNETVYIHSDKTKTQAGQRHYIHTSDVSDALLFLLDKNLKSDHDVIKVPKFNIVGKEEVDNLALAQMVAKCIGKELKYEMTDFHSARPGHDLRYALSGDRMRALGWEPRVKFSERVSEVVHWYLNNQDFL